MRVMIVLAAVAALGAWPATAAPPTAASVNGTSSLTKAVRQAIDRGERLYAIDQAGWHGTDDIRDKYPALLDQVGGNVVTGDANQTDLVFYDKAKSRAVYRAAFAGDKLLGSGPPATERVALTSLESQLIAARDIALPVFARTDVKLCAENPNLAVLPPAKPGDPIVVYLMTPQTELSSFPLGGHYSVEVSADGKAGPVRKYMNSCLDVNIAKAPKGSTPLAFGVTHLLDPTPTEIHVFTSLASKIPLVVGTPNKLMWTVEGNRIQSSKR